jgi:hypothetical protein
LKQSQEQQQLQEPRTTTIMNPGALEDALRALSWHRLRRLAADLSLPGKARKSRAGIVEALMQLHSDPCCSLEVVAAVHNRQPRAPAEDAGDAEPPRATKKRPRKSAAVRDLTASFEAAALLDPPRPPAAAPPPPAERLTSLPPSPDASGEVSETIDAADYDSGLLDDDATSHWVGGGASLASPQVPSPPLIHVPMQCGPSPVG